MGKVITSGPDLSSQKIICGLKGGTLPTIGRFQLSVYILLNNS